MDYLALLIGFIVVCFVVIIAAGYFEARLKKKKEKKEPQEAESPEFIVGRIYQMEDGSFAKYTGNGKFLKVKK